MTVTFVCAKIFSMDIPKIVFMGSPDFAIPILQRLRDHYPIAGVVTQPDRPAGRGRLLMPPPVKILAQKLGIPVIQPEKLRTDDNAKVQLRDWDPAVIIVAAFGQILKTDVLEMAPFGCLNVHASLLPRWRGVSPIQAAILNGDTETGVSIMKMDEGVDTGPVLSQRAIPIQSKDTGGILFDKLADLGAELLIDTLAGYLRNEITPKPQGDSPTPYAPMLNKSDGELDFTLPAEVLARKVRAYNPWPGTFTYWNGNPLKIHAAEPLEGKSPGPGIFMIHDGFPAIGTSDGLILMRQLQPAGKKPMAGDVFLQGAKGWA